MLHVSRAHTFRQLDEQQMGYERFGFMFERTGSKRTFERFLGEIAAVAEERPFFMLEVILYFSMQSKLYFIADVQIQGALPQHAMVYQQFQIPARQTSIFFCQYPRIDSGGSSVWISCTSIVGSMCLLFQGQPT